MKQFLFLAGIALTLLTGCTEGFKKVNGGAQYGSLEYKIISDGNGKKIEHGNFLQVKIVNWYNDGKKDTILGNSQNSMPQVNIFDSVSTPMVFYKILRDVRVGDSVIIRISSDSAIKKNPQGIPPFIKKGHYLYTGLKILNILKDGKAADSASQAEIKKFILKDSLHSIELLKADDKTIIEYLAKNNIKAVKAPMGTYVEIIQPGTGMLIDSTVTVKVNYTGKTLQGKKFDSNVEPSFGHVAPYNVAMAVDPVTHQGIVIKGWTDGFSLLQKGAKARFYVPSSLGYGSHGSGAVIAPDEILVFDIEVLDVLTKEQAAAEVAMERKKMEDMQKHYSDSMTMARHLDSLKKKTGK